MRSNSPTAAASLDEWLRWQEGLHPQGIALGLERVRAVGRRLGLPGGARTITVAGTNGKGSSTILLTECYRAAGFRVGTYTSPHLLRYNERIAIDGVPVADPALVTAFAAIEAQRDGVPLTYFEFGTLAALWLFREAAIDVQVLEVGLGGRLDAVNLVDADCALITSIGLDHVEYLGRTREAIGAEKAGILRPGHPAVCSDPEPPASIGAHAAAVGAPLWQLGRDFRAQPAADTWHWQAPTLHFRKLPPPALPGSFQYANAAGAIAAMVRLQHTLPVPETALRAGLVRMRLPGRCERRGDVILDVAHNVEAARALAENLRMLAPGGAKIVIGMLSDKPVEAFCATLAPIARRFYGGGLPPPRGLAAAGLRERMRSWSATATFWPTVVEAFAAARADEGPAPIVVCGSFLTVAAVTRLLDG